MSKKLTNEQLTLEALVEAKAIFEMFLEGRGKDSAYWDMKFTAWQLDSDGIKRIQRFEIENEAK